MKTLLLIGLLFSAVFTVPLPATLSPTSVVVIESANQLKVLQSQQDGGMP